MLSEQEFLEVVKSWSVKNGTGECIFATTNASLEEFCSLADSPDTQNQKLRKRVKEDFFSENNIIPFEINQIDGNMTVREAYQLLFKFLE